MNWKALLILTAAAGCARPSEGHTGSTTSSSSSARTVASAVVTSTSASAIVSASASASAAASAPSKDDPLGAENLVRDIAWLAAPEQKGRRSASEDEARAAQWIAARLDEAKIPAFEDQRIRPFAYSANVQRKSQNVVGVIEPHGADRKEVIVLGAHYDHLGDRGGKLYLGAEDNASGVALVLGVARALEARRGELGRPVVVAFFGSEETGLNGSIALVSKWSFDKHPVSAMVNVDMIGRKLVDQPGLWVAARVLGVLSEVEPDHAVGVMLPDHPPDGLEKTVRGACKAHDLAVVMPSDLPDTLRPKVEEMARGRSDHAPFEAKKVPFVFFSSGESEDYHEPSDTVEKIDGPLLERRARCVLDTVIALSK